MQIQFEKKLRPIKNSILNSLLVAQWKKNAQDRRRILIGGFDSSPAATLDETWQQANPASQPIRKAGRQGRHTLESTNFPIRLRVLACPLGSRKSSLGPDFCLGQLLARRDWRPWARARAPLVFPLERLVSCWTGSQESCVCLTCLNFLRGSPSKPVLYGISKFIGSFIFFFRRFKHRKKCGNETLEV